MVAIIFILISVALGSGLAIVKAPIFTRIGVYAVIFFISVLIACMPYFVSDPKTWLRTYTSGILLGGIISFLMHVMPAIIAYHVVVFFMKRAGPQ